MHDDHHGSSPAAWTGVAIMLLSAAAACYGVVFGPDFLLPAGVIGFLVGAIIWYALARTGLGPHREVRGDGAHAVHRAS